MYLISTPVFDREHDRVVLVGRARLQFHSRAFAALAQKQPMMAVDKWREPPTVPLQQADRQFERSGCTLAAVSHRDGWTAAAAAAAGAAAALVGNTEEEVVILGTSTFYNQPVFGCSGSASVIRL